MILHSRSKTANIFQVKTSDLVERFKLIAEVKSGKWKSSTLLSLPNSKYDQLKNNINNQ